MLSSCATFSSFLAAPGHPHKLSGRGALMRWLAILVLLLVPALSFAQNGAKAVAAKALQQKPQACGSDASTGTACHANFPAGCEIPKGSGKLLYDAYLTYFKNQIPTVLPTSQGLLTRADFVNKYQSATAKTVT